MISGRVIEMQARVGVVFKAPEHGNLEIEFTIDTGFQGALTLPRGAVEALGLQRYHEIYAILADDSSVTVDVYKATILWRGEELSVAVLAMGKRPLLGTALLEGNGLHAQFVEDGPVSIYDL